MLGNVSSFSAVEVQGELPPIPLLRYTDCCTAEARTEQRMVKRGGGIPPGTGVFSKARNRDFNEKGDNRTA